MVLDTIKRAITEYNLAKKGDKILIGLSGGADSVCLTHALCMLKDELDIEICTAHLNHGIRGEEALRDENFARSFSSSLGIECYVKTVDIPCIAKENGISEETAGRNARYDFFDELCKKYNFTKIATAHNKNDNAETLLMNFMRGSSTNGLCGIPYKRGNIIRPILDVTRAEIEKYCEENNLEYVTDSTNLTDDYTRNKIRHILLPLIEKDFNGNFIKTVTDNSILIKEDNEYINFKAQKICESYVDGNSVLTKKLLLADIAIRRRVVRNMLKSVYEGLNDISSKYISDILELLTKQSGTQINLHDNVIARVEYEKLIIERKKDGFSDFCYEIPVGNSIIITEFGKKVSVRYVKDRKKDGAVYLQCNESDKIVIRSRKSGDKFMPLGMNGSKKVKDYFVDKKIPASMRNTVPIIEINGTIAAVGERVDRRFAFKDSGIKIEFENV